MITTWTGGVGGGGCSTPDTPLPVHRRRPNIVNYNPAHRPGDDERPQTVTRWRSGMAQGPDGCTLCAPPSGLLSSTVFPLHLTLKAIYS